MPRRSSKNCPTSAKKAMIAALMMTARVMILLRCASLRWAVRPMTTGVSPTGSMMVKNATNARMVKIMKADSQSDEYIISLWESTLSGIGTYYNGIVTLFDNDYGDARGRR